jgi:hypothetical protein
MNEPHNPSVAYERTDVNTRAVIWFATALAVGIAVVMVAMFVLYWHYDADESRQKRSDFPVATTTREQLRASDPDKLWPPSPRLEGISPTLPDQDPGRVYPADRPADHDVGRLRPSTARTLYDEWERQLDTWQWADPDHKAARIPIGEAMRRLVAKPGDLLKSRPADGSTVDDVARPPGRSNSGRGPIGGRK